MASGRRRRRFSTCLTILGLVLIGYSVVVVTIGDPVTGLYARWQQARLTSGLNRQLAFERAAWAAHRALFAKRLVLIREERARELTEVRRAAAADRRRLGLGAPMGRVVIP